MSADRLGVELLNRKCSHGFAATDFASNDTNKNHCRTLNGFIGPDGSNLMIGQG